MTSLLAVISTTRLLDCLELNGVKSCDMTDWQQFGQRLRADAPDVLLLLGLPVDCRQSIDSFRKAVPWGYVVAVADAWSAEQSELVGQIDELWPLCDRDLVEPRVRVLQYLAEQNKKWQSLPPELSAQAACSSRLTLLSGQRLVSPGKLAAHLTVSQDLALATTVDGCPFAFEPSEYSLISVLGVNFRLDGVWAAATQVADGRTNYLTGSLARSRARLGDLEEHQRELAERVGLTYELQIERMRSIVLHHEKENLASQISRHGQLAVAGELAAGMAHEIRNPLAAVRGFIQLLRQRLAVANQTTEIRYADYILDEIDRANQILNDFLALTKPTKEQKQLVNLNRLLDELVQFVNHQAMLKGVTLQANLESVPFIWAKSESLKQVFLNLFSNALQATPEGGSIAVTSRFSTGQVQIDLRDTGEGMTPEQVSRIFEPFYTTKVGGTGLGLSICRRIVSEHDGVISVVSSPGNGSTFTVCLPAVKVTNERTSS